jgi:anti-sigma factor RsiW
MTDQHPAPGCAHSELAVGWALHALEPAEEILVAAHLPDCPECLEAVAGAEEVGALLGLSIPAASPSPEMEQRVLALVGTAQATPKREPAPTTSSTAAVPVAPPLTPAVTGQIPRTPANAPQWHAPRRRPRREPICVPDLVKLLSVALLVLACAAAMVFYIVP